MMNNDWFMNYASHRVRLIALEQEWLEIRYWHLFDEQERRGWITKNGRHILIGEDGGGKSGSSLKGSSEIQFDKIDGSKAISEELAAEYRAEYDRFTETFGELSSLTGVDVAPFEENGIYGRFFPESRKIVIYGAGGKDGDKFITQSAQEHKASGEWSTGSKYHSLRHELGHALQMEHSLNDKNWNEKYEKITNIFQSLNKELTGLPPNDIIKIKKSKLSLYGFDKVDEFISESIAEYFQNPKKARSTAKKVVSIILEEV